MILAIRTDAPTVRLVLLQANGKIIADHSWEAHRTLASELLDRLEDLFISQQLAWKDLTGLIVYRGPGSFTGLRIGITVMNTIAYAENLPIVGTTSEGWLEQGVKELKAGKSNNVVLPEYGAEARITRPRK